MYAKSTWFRRLRRWGRAAGDGLVWGCVTLGVVWAAGACFYCPPLPLFVRGLLAVGYVGGMLAFLYRRCGKPRIGSRTGTPVGARVQRRAEARGWLAAATILVFLLTLLLRPSNDRNWVDQQRYLPTVRVTQGLVRLQHFRHCHYRSKTDYQVHWKELQFQRSQLESVWLVVQHFSVLDGIAHTFVSFGYRDEAGQPQYFSVSAEIRREVGESFSALRGLYRQFEMTLVVGDERDLIGARTILRPDDRVYLYRIHAKPENVQALFDRFVSQMQMLEANPQFYNTLTNNCTNSIVQRAYTLTPQSIHWLNPRIALPGHSASLAFDLGLIGDKAGGQTLAELHARARIDPLARRIGFADDFSIRLREPATSEPE